jgi:ankyrin repeat protein
MDRHGASTVMEAIGQVSLEILGFLLEAWTLAKCGNLNWEDNEEGETALEIAANTADIELIRLLLQYKAGDKSLALRSAALACEINMELVELLLASGADVGRTGDCDYNYERPTALDLAACYGELDVLRLFLEHRTVPTVSEKSQALQVAAYAGELDAARLLLEHEADANAPPLSLYDEEPRTALQAAAGNSDVRMVRLLLEAGADVESKNPPEDEQIGYFEQGTALQFAAIAGSVSIVTLLIEKGANVFAAAMGEDGRTAIEGAAEHGRLDVVQLLLNLGVEVAGSRAIHFARAEGHDGVVALLEDA